MEWVKSEPSARRWWLLFLLCWCSCQQCNNWSTFSVVFEDVKAQYGWGKATVNLLTVWGPVIYLPMALVTPWLSARFGLRKCMTLSMALVATGASLRAVCGGKGAAALWLAHLGQMTNAISGPLLLSTPSRLSAEWFPAEERITATSVALLSNYSGTLVCYATVFALRLEHVRVLTLLRIEAVVALLSLAALSADNWLFIDAPLLAPSLSEHWRRAQCTAAQETDDFGEAQPMAEWAPVTAHCSLRSQLREMRAMVCGRPQFAYFAVVYGAYGGVLSGYSAVLDTILGPEDLGLRQSTVAVIGMAMIAAIMVGGSVFGWIQDRMKAHMKLFMVSLVTASGLCLMCFSLLVLWQPSALSVAVCMLVVGSALNAGTYGLGYETAVELVFPLSEVGACAVLTIIFNAFSSTLILLNIFCQPNTVLVLIPLVVTFSGVALVFYRHRTVRSDLDSLPAAGTRKSVAEYSAHSRVTATRFAFCAPFGARLPAAHGYGSVSELSATPISRFLLPNARESDLWPTNCLDADC